MGGSRGVWMPVGAAGTAAAVTAVGIGRRMVLLIPEAVKKLKDEGRKEEHRQWVGWNERRMAAERAGLPFDEPPPAGPPGRDGR